MRRVSCVGLAVLACIASGCGQSRNYAAGTRPAAPIVASVPVNHPAQPVVISSDPVVATPVTRQGVRVFEEKVSGLPGQPDLVKRKATQWYEGPDDGKSFGQSPDNNGVNNNPGYRSPPKGAPATTTAPVAPVNPMGQLPPEDPTKRPTSLSDRGATLLDPIPGKQTEPKVDDEKPIIGSIRVYQTGPNGERIPARRYDERGNLIVEEEEKETVTPKAPTANIASEPKRLPTLPTVNPTVIPNVNPPVPSSPVALPFTPVPVPTITPPPALPAVPTIPAPPPTSSSQPPVYTPQLPPAPPQPQGPMLPSVSNVKVASDVVHAEFRK